MNAPSRLALWFPLRALVSRRWLLSTLVVLAGIAVLVRLGLWQLDRLELRRARNAAIEARLTAPPLDLNAEPLPADPAAVVNRRATARGVFDLDHQVALTLQSWEGLPGVHLLAPLILEGGAGAVLVDRGWIPFEQSAVENWSRFDEPGTQVVTGFVQLSEPAPRGEAASTSAGPTREWYRVDVEGIQAQVPYPLLAIYLLQTSTAAGDELPRRTLPAIDLSEGRHMGYAIQFFLFALILGGGYARTVGKRTYQSKENE